MTPAWFHRALRAGDAGPDVAAVQSILHCHASGVLDEATGAVVRGVQVRSGLPVTGEVDEATAAVIGPRERQVRAVPPLWFGGDHDAALARILGASDPDTLRRFQSGRGLPATGVVDGVTAVELGD